MDRTLFEKLLLANENEALDFKRDQYLFSQASDEQKSEILKDILAFANAWRAVDAHILIGVGERKAARGVVHGVQDHLDDHSLQQFVNAKTQRPVFFNYKTFEIDGVSCGIIRIPVQERPLYLLKGFGKLAAETVYVRRGSSTDEAKPDEIARMGAAGQELPKPRFEAYVQPRLEKHAHYKELKLHCWLFNQGTATADDVVVILQKQPSGVLGLNYENWNSHSTGFQGTGLMHKGPLHPGTRVFLFSFGLGVAEFQNEGEKNRPTVENGAEIAMKVLARNQPPVDFAVTFTASEIADQAMKAFSISS